MTETPRDPVTAAPADPPPPLGSRAPEVLPASENAGEEAQSAPQPDVQADLAPAEPAQPEPEPEPEPVSPVDPGQPVEPPTPVLPAEPVEVPAPVEVPVTAPIEVPAPVEVPIPVAPAAVVDPGYPLPVMPPAPALAPAVTETDAEAGTVTDAEAKTVTDADADAPAPASPSRRSWVPVTAVAVAVLLLAGASGWLGWQVRQESVAEAGRPDAIAAARDAARLLFSYSHDTLEEDFAKGLAVTTGEFRSEYSRTTKEVVTPVAEQYDAIVVAEVVEASLIDAGPGRATALVFLNQGTTSTRVEGQQVDQSRVRMQLVERDGRWLVRAVDAL